MSQTIYKMLLEQNPLEHKQAKWELELNCQLDEWYMRSFKDNILVTNVPKYRSFQYRLLHRSIITNKHLFHWNKRTDKLCSLCGSHEESYIHLFFMCNHVNQLWEWVKEFGQQLGEEVHLEKRNIIFNRIANNPQHVINFVCLIVKQYIYKQRCLGERIRVHQIRELVHRVQNYEKFYARKNNNLRKFCSKWKVFNDPDIVISSANQLTYEYIKQL